MNANKPDRTPLTSNEYYALRRLIGVVSTFANSKGYLLKRAKKIPGTWRDMCMIAAKSERIFAAMLSTVPLDKLRLIEKEIGNVEVNVEVKKRGQSLEKDPFTYVPEDALETLIFGILEDQCAFCEKSRRESKECKWCKAIEATYPFELPELNKEHCRFSGFLIEHEERTGIFK